MRKKGFTLIELLVVIAIIALLLSIVLPSLKKVKELARRTVCQVNLRSIHAGWTMYADDYNDKVSDPRGSTKDSTNPTVEWEGHEYEHWCRKWYLRLYPYLETPEVYACPSWRKKDLEVYGVDEENLVRFQVGEDEYYVTYTANEFVMSFWHPDKSEPYEWKQTELIHKSVANNPVSILLADGIYEVNGWGNWTPMEWSDTPGSSSGRASYRHGGKANFMVADGRIGFLDMDDVESWEDHQYEDFKPSKLQ